MPDNDFPPADVIALLQLLEREGIPVVIDGGWAVDALLGHQTRPHEDLDIAIRHSDAQRLRMVLEARGYSEIARPDTTAFNFVLGNPEGHLVDVHTYEFDAEGNHIDGLPYPPESLTGHGTIDGHRVRCITAEWLVQFHTEYEPDENDFRDVLALCRAFNIPPPAMFERFLQGFGPEPPQPSRSRANPTGDEAMIIRPTEPSDIDAIASVHSAAFGCNTEADLTLALLQDPTASPTLSLLATRDRHPVGHVLFSKASVADADARAYLLAPLAVIPAAQGQGVGAALIANGLSALAQSGVILVFVLGHPGYYTRHGFAPAFPLGYTPPFAIPEEHADAWMVQPLGVHTPAATGGVLCADAINREEYWRE